MCIVTAGDFHRNSGQYQDRALVEPVIITRNGRERTVLISADEYRRLKQLDRESLPVRESDRGMIPGFLETTRAGVGRIPGRRSRAASVMR